MDPLTLIGGGIVAVCGLGYAYPKIKTYLDNRNVGMMPHDAVKTLIDYFTKKECKKGISASVNVGKLLYEECEQHEDIQPVNKLP